MSIGDCPVRLSHIIYRKREIVVGVATGGGVVNFLIIIIINKAEITSNTGLTGSINQFYHHEAHCISSSTRQSIYKTIHCM